MTDDVAVVLTEQAPAAQVLTDPHGRIRHSVAERLAESIRDDTLVRLKRGEAFESRGTSDERVHRVTLVADKLLSDPVVRATVNVPNVLPDALEREFPMLDGNDCDWLADSIVDSYGTHAPTRAGRA